MEIKIRGEARRRNRVKTPAREGTQRGSKVQGWLPMPVREHQRPRATAAPQLATRAPRSFARQRPPGMQCQGSWKTPPIDSRWNSCRCGGSANARAVNGATQGRDAPTIGVRRGEKNKLYSEFRGRSESRPDGLAKNFPGSYRPSIAAVYFRLLASRGPYSTKYGPFI